MSYWPFGRRAPWSSLAATCASWSARVHRHDHAVVLAAAAAARVGRGRALAAGDAVDARHVREHRAAVGAEHAALHARREREEDRLRRRVELRPDVAARRRRCAVEAVRLRAGRAPAGRRGRSRAGDRGWRRACRPAATPRRRRRRGRRSPPSAAMPTPARSPAPPSSPAPPRAGVPPAQAVSVAPKSAAAAIRYCMRTP